MTSGFRKKWLEYRHLVVKLETMRIVIIVLMSKEPMTQRKLSSVWNHPEPWQAANPQLIHNLALQPRRINWIKWELIKSLPGGFPVTMLIALDGATCKDSLGFLATVADSQGLWRHVWSIVQCGTTSTWRHGTCFSFVFQWRSFQTVNGNASFTHLFYANRSPFSIRFHFHPPHFNASSAQLNRP